MEKLHQANKQFKYIDKQTDLDLLCEQLSKQSFIALDTEFVRTKTLFPLLGLLQIFDGQQVYLIDNTAVESLEGLKSVISNDNILKVIHSCSEDLDALYFNVGSYPKPIFDTQIAAHFLDMGNSLGYANIVDNLCGLIIDKTESRTDWLARPLRAEQLEYAAADVTYLHHIYQILQAKIEALGLVNSVIDEAQLMVDKKANPIPNHLAYLNFSNAWKLNRKSLYALKLLAKWRLEVAQAQNMTLNFILRENLLLEIAMKLPKTANHLANLYGISRKQVRLYSEPIIAIVEKVLNADETDYPAKIQRLIEFPQYKNAASEIKKLVQKAALELGIPESAIASKKQINDVLKYLWFASPELVERGLKPDLLTGWRRELLLPSLQKLFDETGKYDALRSL